MLLHFYKKKLAEKISTALGKESPGTNDIMEAITSPPEIAQGQLALPVFRFVPKGTKPDNFALEFAKKLEKDELFEKFESFGPYVNVFLCPQHFAKKVLEEILNNPKKEKKSQVMVEYASPNTNKPLHIGHLRNITLGISISNLFEQQGHPVVRAQVINDRGVHICKSMLGYQKWGNNETPEGAGMKADHFVGKYYIDFIQKAKENPELEEEAQEMLQKWENGDVKVKELWEKMRTWAHNGIFETYDMMGAKFDKNYYESELFEKAKEIVKKGLEKGVFVKAENGALVAPLKKFKLDDKPVLRGDGTSLYITQDIYMALNRFEEFPKIDRIVYVVGNEQELHFRQLFSILELLKVPQASKCYHLAYNLVNTPEGKISTRAGSAMDADGLIENLIALSKEELEKRNENLDEKEINRRAKIIAIAALKFFMLKPDAKKVVLFNPEESISFEGQTGPYMLYSFARCNSILKKSGEKPNKEKIELLEKSKEKELIFLLSQNEEILEDSLKHYSPHILVHYLLELANAFNSYYHETKIIQEKKELEQARLVLVQGVQSVLGKGLNVLGIETLEEM
jgi:arginyl-tRNA synthetase